MSQTPATWLATLPLAAPLSAENLRTTSWLLSPTTIPRSNGDCLRVFQGNYILYALSINLHTHTFSILIRSKSGSFRSGSVSPQSLGGWEAGQESPCSLVSPGTSHTVNIMNNSATSLESGFMVSILFTLFEDSWLGHFGSSRSSHLCLSLWS